MSLVDITGEAHAVSSIIIGKTRTTSIGTRVQNAHVRRSWPICRSSIYLNTMQGTVAESETEVMSDTSLDKVTTSCGWFSFRPKWLQTLNKPWCFLVAISVAAFFQGAIINGFVNVSLTSIETRFGLSAKLVGVIPPSYDVGSLVCVIPIAYVGGRVSQTRILGVCLFIAAVGAAILCLPHFMTLNKPSPMDALKDLQSTSVGFCGNESEVSTSSGLKAWVVVFYIGMFVMGIGFSPIWSNCFDYLDKNLSHEDFPLYSGIYSLAGIIGPGVGYILGGYFLYLPFDDVQKDSQFYKDMSDSQYQELTENPNFIGAYWIGFVISSIGLLLISIPVGGFPYQFPGSKSIRDQKENRVFGEKTAKETSEISTDLSWKDFKEGTLSILTNPVVLCIAFAGAMEIVFSSVVSSFAPKYLEIVFNFTSSEAALTAGLILIPCAVAALISGGLIPKLCKMNTSQLLILCVISSFVTFVSTFGFFVSCGQADFIEPSSTITYKGQTCNVQDCSCSELNYKPFCLDKKTMLFSPCYYGCKNGTLSGCSCYNPSINSDLQEGSCEISEFCNSSNFYILVLFFVISIFSLFFNVPAAESALNRSVQPNFRSLAFGFDLFVLRLLGAIPAPLIAGAMFDNGCTYWQRNEDGGKESCLRYDESVTKGFTGLCVTSTGLMTILFLLAFVFHKKCGVTNDDVIIDCEKVKPKVLNNNIGGEQISGSTSGETLSSVNHEPHKAIESAFHLNTTL